MLIVGILVAVIVYNLALIIFNSARGWPAWDHQSQRAAVRMWSSIVIAGGVIAAVLFGVGALLSIWPFWLALVLMSSAAWGIGRLFAQRNARRQTLAERLSDLRAQGPLPPWAADVDARRASLPPPRGLLQRFDDWLGL